MRCLDRRGPAPDAREPRPTLSQTDVLGLPSGERNRLLEAAGLAAGVHGGGPGLRGAGSVPHRDRPPAAAHEPYPALVVDGRYTVVDANAAAVGRFGADLISSNVIRRYMDEAARAAILNWPDVARAGLARIRDRVREAPQDAELAELLTLAEAAVAQLPSSEAPDGTSLSVPSSCTVNPRRRSR